MMIISSTGIHCPCNIVLSPPGGEEGGVPLVSRTQRCLPRKLIYCRAKLDSALLHEEHGSPPVDVTENFSHLSDTGSPVPAAPGSGRSRSRRPRAVLRVSVPGPSRSLPPHILYLLELGFDLEQIKAMAHRYPSFAYYSQDKIRPLIEFLLDIGMSKLDLAKVLVRDPALCRASLSENVIPTMTFLETLGVDRTKWAKVISRCPRTLVRSRKKIEETVQFLRELGLSEERIATVLTGYPGILSRSVEGTLRPIAEYIQSSGVDITIVLQNSPQITGLSLEANLKPVTAFFLENGFSTEELASMISKCSQLYSRSLKGNLVPKWEFFLTMDYPREELVKCPIYFGFSLEERIKPRYNLMKEAGVRWSLGHLLIPKDDKFKSSLKKKIEKLQLKESRDDQIQYNR